MRLLLVLLALVFQTSLAEIIAYLVSTNTNEPTNFNLQLENTYQVPVALLRWNLPFDERFGGENNFVVLKNGSPVAYIGAKVKYADPTFLDYLVIPPHESVTVDVKLENLYNFSSPGSYEVQFQYRIVDFLVSENFQSIPRKRVDFQPSETITSNSVTISVTKPTYPVRLTVPYPCSTSERNQITQGQSALTSQLAPRALTVIREGSTSTYTEWFGSFTQNNYQTALEVITNIRANTVVAHQCDDTPNVYAYVYPSDSSHTIYLCSAYWPSEVIGGWDTKAGTLLHELSHFNDIGGTDDHAYGTSACRNLARSRPDLAVNNADSFEYFGESQFP